MTLKEELVRAAATGLNGSPGDSLAARALQRIEELEEQIAQLRSELTAWKSI